MIYIILMGAASVLLLFSWFPYELGNAAVGQNSCFDAAAARAIAPHVGLLLTAVVLPSPVLSVAADEEWSESEMAEWNASIAKASRRMNEWNASLAPASHETPRVGPEPTLRGCLSELRVTANDIACGSSPFCKVFSMDAGNYTDALWCEGEGAKNKYDRVCPGWPLRQGLERQVVVYRKSNPRLYRVRVDDVNGHRAKLHIEGFESLEGHGRGKDVTLYKDECAHLMALNGYGMLKVCAESVYR